MAEGLVKHFGETKALDGLDLNVPEGTVLGLLGPNGAGKTTAVRVLTTLLRPDAGVASIDGVDVLADPQTVRGRIGLTGQYAAVEERMTGRENLELIGSFFHMSKAARGARASELLERFELTEAADRVTNTYSGGMRRRLDIAMSLVARPRVLFLDEPTTGLDPRSRIGMWSVIEELGADGTTIVLTTQYLEEADQLADNVVVIDRGVKIAEGSVDELKDRIGGDRIRVSIARTENLDRARSALADLVTGEIEVDPESATTLMAPIRAGGGVVPAAIRALDESGADVVDVEVRRPTLDDVFLNLTGRRTETEEESA
ncbi:MAG: ATP-binding cassette domain-containing protein [Actinomycetota bacterium]